MGYDARKRLQEYPSPMSVEWIELIREHPEVVREDIKENPEYYRRFNEHNHKWSKAGMEAIEMAGRIGERPDDADS